MAYTKFEYDKTEWKNKSEGTSTPIDKKNLNHIEEGIYGTAKALDEAYRELKIDIDSMKLLGFSIDNEGYVIQTIEEEE